MPKDHSRETEDTLPPLTQDEEDAMILAQARELDDHHSMICQREADETADR